MIKPVPATREILLAVLRDMIARVEADDSYDGSLTWSSTYGPPCTACGGSGGVVEILKGGERCPTCDGMGDQPIPDGADFWLTANYRTGNTMGQGGMRIIGKVTD